jgi:hypothetical protein
MGFLDETVTLQKTANRSLMPYTLSDASHEVFEYPGPTKIPIHGSRFKD